MIELPVRSDRLVIDALTVDDAPAVAAYRNDPDVARYQSWPLPYGVEDAAGLAAAGQLAIRVGERGQRTELVGDAMLDRVPATEHAVEIGMTIAPAAQGRGLATEAVTALVDAVFAAGRQRSAVRPKSTSSISPSVPLKLWCSRPSRRNPTRSNSARLRSLRTST